jgi:cytochrome c556
MTRAIPLIALTAAALCCPGSNSAASQPPAGAGAAPPSAGQLIAARQAGMHMAATLYYRGIKVAATNGADPKEQVHEAEGIALWAAAIPGLFPAGSGGEDSRARPEIWDDPADFARKATDLRAAATRLLELARAGDRPGFAAQAPAVEAACAACHSAYRAD